MTPDCACEPVLRNGAAMGVVGTLVFLGVFTALQALVNHRAHVARERRRMQHETPAEPREGE